MDINQNNMDAVTKYLNRFFAEKNIPNMDYQIEGKDGVTHFLNTEVVIEHILNTCESEKKKISQVLRAIDYKNGSVSHFIKYMAYGLVRNYSS